MTVPRSSNVTPEVRINAMLAGGNAITLAAAESCTGGGIAARLTSIAGSSDYFLGSAVTYSNDAKINLLGVSRDIIDSVGAVSEECALAMAEGARRIFGSSLAIATTGIAGPGGATDRKPVGLVYVALATQATTSVVEHHFAGDRMAVVNAAIDMALEWLAEVASESNSVAAQPTKIGN